MEKDVLVVVIVQITHLVITKLENVFVSTGTSVAGEFCLNLEN